MRGALALASVSGAVLAVVAVVHYQQERDKREMHKGVIKDKERLAIKRLQKQQLLQQQGEKGEKGDKGNKGDKG